MNDDHEIDESQAEAVPPQAAPAPLSKGQAFKAVFANKKSRNHILVIGGIVMIAALAGVAVMRKASRPEVLPSDARGVQALPDPGPMKEGPTALSEAPAYKAVVEEVSANRIASAEAAGKSALPLADTLRTPEPAAQPSAKIAAPATVSQAGALPGQTAQDQYALRATAEEEQRRQQAIAAQVIAAQEFMKGRQEAWAPRGTEILSFGGDRTTVAVKVSAVAAAGASPAATTGTAQAAATGASNQVTLIPAGTLVSAVTVNRVNTDIKAPIVATIASGPFAGAKLIGTQVREGELAKLDFTTMSLPGVGTSVPVQAFSLDAATLDAGIATEVDRKLFTRYLLKPAAAAIAAVGEAAKSAGSTTVSVMGVTSTTNAEMTPARARQIAGGALAGQVAKDIDAQPTDPTVMVASKTVIGVMFVSDVVYTPKAN